jgi:hypothetical protein
LTLDWQSAKFVMSRAIAQKNASQTRLSQIGHALRRVADDEAGNLAAAWEPANDDIDLRDELRSYNCSPNSHDI